MLLYQEWQKKNNLNYDTSCIPSCNIYNTEVSNNGEIILLIDDREPMKERLIDIMKEQNIVAINRTLPMGDYMWIIKEGNEEKILPYIVERKTWDDFNESIITGRFDNQKKLLKLSGIENLIWLFEGSKKKMIKEKNLMENLQKKSYNLLKEGFSLWITSNFRMTCFYLIFMTRCLLYTYKNTNQFILRSLKDLSNNNDNLLKEDTLTNENNNNIEIKIWTSEKWKQFFLSEEKKKKLKYKKNKNQLYIIQGVTQYLKNKKKELNKVFKLFYQNYETSQSLEFLTNNLNKDDQISYELIEFYLIWMKVIYFIYFIYIYFFYEKVYYGIWIQKTKDEKDNELIFQIFNSK